MASQYALRFETGERRGELVPIVGASMPGRAFTIGRKPGNSLQVTDASVSGRHAEITVDEGASRISVRDVGSTNGTHVAGSRVEEADLGHGDAFLLGKVRFTVVDQALEGAGDGGSGLELELDGGDDFAPVEPVRGAAPGPGAAAVGSGAAAGEGGSIEISAADLARSRRSSRLAPIVLVGAAAAAVAAFVLTRGGGDEGGDGERRRSSAASVDAPAGYALAGAYSFESSGLEGWTEDGGALTAFEWTSSAARTGRRGLRAELRAGQRPVQLASDPVRVPDGSLVRIAAAVRVDGDATARVGVDYGGGLVPLGSARGGGEDFTLIEASGVAPGGASTARVVVEVVAGGEAPEAGGEGEAPAVGTVDVDDVQLAVEAGAGSPVHSTGDWRIAAQSGADGAPRALAIDWRGETYASLLGVEDASGDLASLEVRSDGDELLVTAGAAGTLRLHASAERVGGAITTLGPASSRDGSSGSAAGGEHPGFAQHGAPFESPSGATSLIVGADASQMRLRFESGRAITGRTIAGRGGSSDEESPGGLAFSAPVERGETVALQFDFSEERALAERLARRARQEASRDEPGVAFATWSELLEEVPYSSDLVAAAGAAQSRITAEGRQALAALRDEVERARFFRLGDLFREKLVRAEELQQRYAGSEVAALSAELAAEIQAELVLLEESSVRDEAARLAAIRAALERAGAANLADEVERYRGAVAPAGSGATTNGGSADGGAGASTPDGGGL